MSVLARSPSIRLATMADVPHLVDLNRAAYPDLIQDEVVWTEAQLRAHLGTFPEGQLVAVTEDCQHAGAISTFILHRDIDPMAPPTGRGSPDGATFPRHDPSGDTLYLADVYVGPAHWGRGVGKALYRALFDLCKRLGLRRVVAGGRLF